MLAYLLSTRNREFPLVHAEFSVLSEFNETRFPKSLATTPASPLACEEDDFAFKKAIQHDIGS